MIVGRARTLLRKLGFDVVRTRPPRSLRVGGHAIPDVEFYTPLFSPWRGYGDFARYARLAAPHTLVSPDRCWILYSAASQCLRLDGDLWECGVYKGGTATMLAQMLADAPARATTRLHLFDTFAGMPETDPQHDWHRSGDFSDTSLEAVRSRVGHRELVRYHQGLIPDSFATHADATIAFAHVDVDIHQAVLDCCTFIVPRLVHGGIMVFDDYGFPSCPGARRAVDEYFAATPFRPLILPTGQAVVFKSEPWPRE